MSIKTDLKRNFPTIVAFEGKKLFRSNKPEVIGWESDDRKLAVVYHGSVDAMFMALVSSGSQHSIASGNSPLEALDNARKGISSA